VKSTRPGLRSLRSIRSGGALLLGVALLIACAFAGGCGYSAGLGVADHHSSIGLEIFGNDAYERDLERPFDDEMSRALRDFSDAPIVDVSKADVLVRGMIRTYLRRSGIRSPANVPLETGVTIEVTAALYDRASGKRLSEDCKAVSSVGYLIGPTNNELDARDRALRHIAEELVLDLFAPRK
jgi:hypothetical protein